MRNSYHIPGVTDLAAIVSQAKSKDGITAAHFHRHEVPCTRWANPKTGCFLVNDKDNDATH